MPASGHCQSPCEATTSSVPRKGAVQVNDVSVNARPMSSVPAMRPRPESAFEAAVTSFAGSVISHTPNRLSANAMKSAATPRFSHGFAANRFNPAAPYAIAIVNPTAVNVRMMPRP